MLTKQLTNFSHPLFLKKKLSSQNENYFFCNDTLTFFYRHNLLIFHKIFGLFIFGHFFCPFFKSQNTFQNSRLLHNSSYVGIFFITFFNILRIPLHHVVQQLFKYENIIYNYLYLKTHFAI